MDEFVKMFKMLLLSNRQMWYSVIVAIVALLVGVGAAEAQEPPPTPTLAPIISDTTSATQTYQLQSFARSGAYLAEHTTVYTATVGGATWALERKFTYGEAGITITVMALALVEVMRLLYQAVNDGRVRW